MTINDLLRLIPDAELRLAVSAALHSASKDTIRTRAGERAWAAFKVMMNTKEATP